MPVRTASGIWALDEKKIQGSPSIKYRGIFINDEQPALTNWIKYVSPRIWSPGREAHVLYAVPTTRPANTEQDSIIISTRMFLSFY